MDISWLPGGSSDVKHSLGDMQRDCSGSVGGVEQRRDCSETKWKTGDWRERSSPEGGMFVSITRCSQVQSQNSKEGPRHHRLNSMS